MEFKIIASLIKQKNFSAAKVGLLELISKKINLENDFKNIYFTLSQVCIQLNQLNESKKYLAKHLEINPKDCEALLYLATLQLKTRDIENTEKYETFCMKTFEDLPKEMEFCPKILNIYEQQIKYM